MLSNKLFIVLLISFLFYFILDFVLGGIMFYIVSGSILGSIYELSGKRISVFLSSIIWIALLIGTVILFFRTQNRSLQIILIFLISVLLYVVDIIIGQIGEPFMTDTEEIKKIASVGKILKWIGLLLKSIILSLIIYLGIIKD